MAGCAVNAAARVLLPFIVVLLVTSHVTAIRKKCPARTSLATFNAAFVPFFPGVNGPEIEERTQLLIQQIDSSGVDIICLQEILTANIQREIYRALKDEYPYILSALNLTIEGESLEMACDLEELQQVGLCVGMQCGGLTGLELVGCTSLRCLDPIASLSPRCRDCFSQYSVVGQEVQCLSLPASRFETNYGLMLLSKRELKNGRASPFNPQSQFRGFLEASVDGVGNLICTHLTALISTDVYGGPPFVSPFLYTTYDEQQYDELTTLFELVTSMETPILMGDFNNGPASPGINFSWELPFHYGLITARGFVSPFVLKDGRCTFCADNPFANFPVNLVIDHIYLTTDAYKGRVLSAKRFLDDVFTPSGSALSDHYGVVVTLKDIRTNCRWWENRLFYCPAERLLLGQLPAPQAELNRLCAAASG